ncbi:hypothetical protein HK104_000553 [Borealophlyctis nickersoniae]|nr:hypothetical protein HK104_000553 [Borealophlyctis nickersoniae]
MASTAHKDPEQVRERFEPESEVERKAAQFAQWVRESKHFIAFTGAGVSTSAGIPDFRGPQGVWTMRAQGKVATSRTTTLQAVPTLSHMCLVELQNRGALKYLVSQNTDGLHRKSGIRPDVISELHGNSNREYCKQCGKEYIRDYRAVASYRHDVHDHKTGRKCSVCGSDLHDSIINFNEPLPQQPLRNAISHAYAADLCLVLGSSLTVSPANTIPEIVATKSPPGKLCIVNLQRTPYDHLAHLRVWANTDDFMGRVMRHLGYPIPDFMLHRRIVVDVKEGAVEVRGVDVDGTHASLLSRVEIDDGKAIADDEPFVFRMRAGLRPGVEIPLKLHFMGWYGEPSVTITHRIEAIPSSTLYIMDYNPKTAKWNWKREGDTREAGKTDGTHADVKKADGKNLQDVAGSGAVPAGTGMADTARREE